jgi:hypothetical protein
VNVALARTWKFKPGQYMYLYVPKLGLWTSHPFSVAWTASEETTIADKRDSSDSFNLLLDEKPRPTVSFLIKRRDGFTCKLLRKAMNADERQFRATAFAEGPFGTLAGLMVIPTLTLNRWTPLPIFLRNCALGSRWNRDYSPHFIYA